MNGMIKTKKEGGSKILSYSLKRRERKGGENETSRNRIYTSYLFLAYQIKIWKLKTNFFSFQFLGDESILIYFDLLLMNCGEWISIGIKPLFCRQKQPPFLDVP